MSVDISTPPKKLGSTWTFDDLELNPYVTRDGTFGVEDEDEFDRGSCQVVKNGLPPLHLEDTTHFLP